MSPIPTLVLYCALVLIASLGGGWATMRMRLSHRRLEIAISFVSGVMLGIALLHMLPHALIERAEVAGRGLNAAVVEPVIIWLLLGFLTMFFLERFFCFHHHEPPAHEAPEVDEGKTKLKCDHGHQLSWTGALAGLTMHSLIAGIALAASVAAEGKSGVRFAGFGAFLVIFLHKPFDALTVETLMTAEGKSRRLRHVVNGLFGLVVPAGAALFYFGLRLDEGGSLFLVSGALAFSAGTFLCIALSDLLPELQFHSHDRIKLSAALLLGLALAWGVSRMDRHEHHDSGSANERIHQLAIG